MTRIGFNSWNILGSHSKCNVCQKTSFRSPRLLYFCCFRFFQLDSADFSQLPCVCHHHECQQMPTLVFEMTWMLRCSGTKANMCAWSALCPSSYRSECLKKCWKKFQQSQQPNYTWISLIVVGRGRLSSRHLKGEIDLNEMWGTRRLLWKLFAVFLAKRIQEPKSRGNYL